MLKQTTGPLALWRHRSLLAALLQRELRSRYSGSVAGALWLLIHPLFLLGLYALVFGLIFQVRIPQLPPDIPYVLFIGVVLWPWLAFQEALVRGTMAVQNHAALVKKVAFEHELLVYTSTLASFIVHGTGYAIVLSVLGLLGYSLQWQGVLIVPWLMVVLWVIASALALVFAALQVFVRDVEQVLGQVMALVFYATPILYPISMLPQALQKWIAWNPLGHITEPIRQVWLVPHGYEDLIAAWPTAVMTMTLCAVLWWGCLKIFHRLSPYFEDML